MSGGSGRALVIAGANLQRTFRDRTALFFVLVLPIVIIVVIGSTFGAADDALDVGLVDDDGASALARELAARLESTPALEVHRYDGVEGLERALRRDEIVGGVVIPSGYDAGLRGGQSVTARLVSDPASDATPAVRSAVGGVIASQAAVVAAARFGADRTGRSFDDSLEVARRLERSGPGVDVDQRSLGRGIDPVTSRFAYTAPSNLVLFVFINTVATAAALVESRRLGVSRRMLATPTSTRTILAGEALGRFGVALLQAVLILGVGALLFGVDWGDPWGAAALVMVFVLVATGAGMLVGAVARTGDQAGAIGAPVGIALGMLGGCMWPLEVVGDAMRAVGHVVPHAWAMDAWSDLIFDRQGLGGIAAELGVLTVWAMALMAVATWRLHAALTRS